MSGNTEMVSGNGNAPLSWRDVYRAVGESEDRIIGKIVEAERVTRAIIERHDVRLQELKSQDDKLVGQLSVWRSIAVFLGLPGIVALIAIVVAAASNLTVTGPQGLLP